ncbi:hypothetical protein H4R35_004889 [Dimargaris xerosporica]|nr:hypothetical protein H4R35_004889 [Dimargaris xerosporica]
MPLTASALLAHPDAQQKGSVFAQSVLERMVLVETQPQRMVWEFTATRAEANPVGKLHGGCIMVLLSYAGKLLLMAQGLSKDEAPKPSPIPKTVDMSLECMAAGDLDSPFHIEAEVLKNGRNITYVQSKVTQGDSKRLVALANQTLRPLAAKL